MFENEYRPCPRLTRPRRMEVAEVHGKAFTQGFESFGGRGDDVGSCLRDVGPQGASRFLWRKRSIHRDNQTRNRRLSEAAETV